MLVFGGRRLEDALAGEAIELAGDRATIERFLTLFPLPGHVAPVAAIEA